MVGFDYDDMYGLDDAFLSGYMDEDKAIDQGNIDIMDDLDLDGPAILSED